MSHTKTTPARIARLLSSVLFVVLFLGAAVPWVNQSFGEILLSRTEAHGAAPLFLYVAAVALAVVLAPLSALPLLPLAAGLFGPLRSALASVIGWSIGGALAFLLARFGGRPLLQRFVSLERLCRFETALPAEASLLWLIFFRMIVPVDVLSYALGLFSTMPFSRYLVGTAIGVIPFAFIFSYAGAAAFSGNAHLLVLLGVLGGSVFLCALYLTVRLRRPYTGGMTKKLIVTHDGTFHADEVFATAALLLLLKNEAEVVRTRDREKIAAAEYVVDVGEICDAERNRFDHHQKEGAGARPNKIPYAAFGLVWKQFGVALAGSGEVAERIDRKLVQPLDAHDNGVALFSETLAGVYPYELSDVIRAGNPTGREDEGEREKRFREAVSFAQKLLRREIEHGSAQMNAARKVEEAVRQSEERRLIVLNEDIPWQETLARLPGPLFVVHPQDGNWFVECVRDNPNAFVNRKDLPAQWAGLRDAEFGKVTGVPDALFCHRNRFMAVAKTKEGALELARLALKYNGSK